MQLEVVPLEVKAYYLVTSCGYCEIANLVNDPIFCYHGDGVVDLRNTFSNCVVNEADDGICYFNLCASSILGAVVKT
jgi:hypothetical protein